jgi:DNA-binding FrmR family transcriptional regulator
MKENAHETHPGVVNRLKRAEGHLRKIIAMSEEQRSCLDLTQQLHAVEQAIASPKKTRIHNHIDHCLERSVGPMARHARGPIEEFKEITEYL